MKAAQQPGGSQLDRFLPEFDVSARYGIEVAAPPSVVYEALRHADFSDSLLVRALMSLRSGRIARRGPPKSLTERLAGTGFVELTSAPAQELVIGVAGRFWRPDGGRYRELTADSFAGFHLPGYAKAAWNFLLEPRHGGTRVTTETRVQCFGRAARRSFKAYWLLVGPFSGLIRKAMLAQIKRAAEGSR